MSRISINSFVVTVENRKSHLEQDLQEITGNFSEFYIIPICSLTQLWFSLFSFKELVFRSGSERVSVCSDIVLRSSWPWCVTQAPRSVVVCF